MAPNDAKMLRHGAGLQPSTSNTTVRTGTAQTPATIGLLKGKSASEVMSFAKRTSRMVRGRHFWARGYCVGTVGLDKATVREYIRNQEEQDRPQEELDLRPRSREKTPVRAARHATNLRVVSTPLSRGQSAPMVYRTRRGPGSTTCIMASCTWPEPRDSIEPAQASGSARRAP